MVGIWDIGVFGIWNNVFVFVIQDGVFGIWNLGWGICDGQSGNWYLPA